MTTKDSKESEDSIADLVGVPGLAGRRMAPGPVLEMMDLCAVRVAQKHADSHVVTASMDIIALVNPVHHRDFVRVSGRVISVGSSSIVVEVKVHRRDIETREWEFVCSTFSTLVAINKDGSPNTEIPALTTYAADARDRLLESRRRKELSLQWQQLQDQIDPALISVDIAEDPANRDKQEFLQIEDTLVTAKKQALTQRANVNNTIFAGEILGWMDSVATHCANVFAKNTSLMNIGINRTVFKRPIYVGDWVEAGARVVFVRNHTLEVEVEFWVERDGERSLNMSALFIYLQYSPNGTREEICTGLKLLDEDKFALCRYYRAKQRFSFWQQHDAKPIGSAGA